jgi:hypothetical protein
MLWLSKIESVCIKLCLAIFFGSCGYVHSRTDDYLFKIPQYKFELNNDSLFSTLFLKYPSDSIQYDELKKSIAEFEKRSNEEIKILDSIDNYAGWFKNKTLLMNEHFDSNFTKQKFNSLKDKIKYIASSLDNSIDTLYFIREPLIIGNMPLKLQNFSFRVGVEEVRKMERNILLKKLSSISKNEQ